MPLENFIDALANSIVNPLIRGIIPPEEACLQQGLVPKYNEDGSFAGCYDPNNVHPKPDKVEDTKPPKVSVPPIEIYREPEYRPDRPILIPIPLPPPRRLPSRPNIPTLLPPTGGNNIQTEPSKTYSVGKSVKDGIYGCLLHEPVVKSPIKIQICTNPDFNDSFKEKNKNNALNFFRWLLERSGEAIAEEAITTLCKVGIALISRHSLNTINPKTVTAIFGCDAIAEWILEFVRRNQYGFVDRANKVGLNYEIVPCLPEEYVEEDILDGIIVGSPIQDADFNIDVINQVNIDTAPLVNIVASIENKIEVQINAIIAGVLAGINFSPCLELEAELTILNNKLSNFIDIEFEQKLEVNLDLIRNTVNELEISVSQRMLSSTEIQLIIEILNLLQDVLSDVDFNVDIINQINVDTEPLVNIITEINNNIDVQANVIVSNILAALDFDNIIDVDFTVIEEKIDDVGTKIDELTEECKKDNFQASHVLTYNHDCDSTTEDKTLTVGEMVDGELAPAKNFSALWQFTRIVSEQLMHLNSIICTKLITEAIEEPKEKEQPNCFPLFPGEQFSEFKIPTQLSLTFGQEYPYQTGSLWHMNIPYPIAVDELNWETHFEPMSRTLGDHQGRVYFEGTKMWVGGYGITTDSITEFLENHIIPLCNLPVQKRPDGSTRIRTTSGGNIKRNPENRTIRCVRAVYAEIDPDTSEVMNIKCFVPPVESPLE